MKRVIHLVFNTMLIVSIFGACRASYYLGVEDGVAQVETVVTINSQEAEVEALKRSLRAAQAELSFRNKSPIVEKQFRLQCPR